MLTKAEAARINGVRGGEVAAAKRLTRIAEYNKNPRCCAWCGKPLGYDQHKRHCSRSCGNSDVVRNRYPEGRSPTFFDRFWKYVDKRGPNECWPWRPTELTGKYGQLAAGRGLPPARAHVVAWEIANGPVPKGLHVCHSCDYPPCCNPAHLWIGTNKDNTDDKVKKERASRTRLLGTRHPRAKLTEELVLAIRTRLLSWDGSRRDSAAIIKEFGINKHILAGMRGNKSWPHVQVIER